VGEGSAEDVAFDWLRAGKIIAVICAGAVSHYISIYFTAGPKCNQEMVDKWFSLTPRFSGVYGDGGEIETVSTVLIIVPL